MRKQRQSNFEALRVVAMFMVLLLHANYSAIGWPRVAHFTDTPLTAFLQLLLFESTIVGVNVFVLISGWFGIRAKLSGFLRLCFLLLIAWIAVLAGCFVLGVDLSAVDNLFESYYSLWFILSYLLLYILSPILNVYVEHASARQLLTLLLCFFTFQFITYDFADDINKGYSVVSFIGLYLLARFLRLHASRWLSYIPSWAFLTIYAGGSLLTTLYLISLSQFSTAANFYNSFNLYAAYAAPNVVICAVGLFLFFSRLSLSSGIVNRLGAASLMVYATHQNLLVRPYYVDMVKFLHTEFSTPIFALLLFLCLCAVYGASVLLNELATYLWKRLNRYYNHTLEKIIYHLRPSK